MTPKIGLNLDSEIDFDLLIYSENQIREFEGAAIEIEKYFHLSVTEEHFNEVANV